jgi:hypothetical protein
LFEIKSTYTSIAFGLFLLAYVILFTILVIRLKRKFPIFFATEKKRIYTISSLIIISLIARVIFQAIYGIRAVLDQFYLSEYYRTWFAPIMVLLSISLGIYLPLGAMLYSLSHSLSSKRKIATQNFSKEHYSMID